MMNWCTVYSLYVYLYVLWIKVICYKMSLNRFFCRLNFLLYMCIFVLNLGDDIYRLLDIGNIIIL